MKPKTVLLLAVAVGSGLLAMLGVQQAMSTQQAQPEETVQVLVARQDIEVGVQLTEQNVEFRAMPVSAVPQDPVLKPEQYELRSPTYALKAGDIVRLSKLSAPNVFGKSTQIKEGMRVVSIPVDDTQTVSGLLSPGDRVDVLVTYNHRSSRGQTLTKTLVLLEYVEVFATDDKTQREANAPGGDTKNKTRNVALLLAPEHVPYIMLAQSKGKLGLAWRRRDDDTVASVGSINEQALDELKGIAPLSDHLAGRSVAPPLYSDWEGGDFPTGPTADLTDTPQDRAGVHATLEASEQGVPPAAPTTTSVVEPPPAPRPTWKLAIYVGNQPVEHEFELPEEPQPAPPVPSDQDAQQNPAGGTLWELLKQAL